MVFIWNAFPSKTPKTQINSKTKYQFKYFSFKNKLFWTYSIFTGRRCEHKIDYCANPTPCQNGASCFNKLETYSCSCKPGYTDRNCSTEINECEPSPCQKNGTCTDLVNDFKCDCPLGFDGKRCEESKILYFQKNQNL